MENIPTAHYQIKVSLRGSDPSIWRRILVPADCSLARLHLVLQAVMGWENYHLHEFKIKGQDYGDPADDDWGDRNIEDERYFRLNELFLKQGSIIEYTYDFGDGWGHDLEVEDINLRDDSELLPCCLDGEFSGPPEDVGGIGSYYEYLRALKDRDHPEHKEWLAWQGPFNPARFVINAINKRLFWLSNDTAARSAGLSLGETNRLIMAFYPSLTRWAEGLDGGMVSVADELPARRNMLTMLKYLTENKVKGTSSSGNLPLKPAKEISAKFVHPPVWKIEFGDYSSELRSSAEIWDIDFLVILADVGGLITRAPGRRLEVTEVGYEFLSLPPALQTWYMLAVWWTKVNWLVAYPYEISLRQIDFDFVNFVGINLLNLSIEEEIPIEGFIDQLKHRDQWSHQRDYWKLPSETSSRLIHICAIEPLIDLGILSASNNRDEKFKLRYTNLSAFKMTAFGRHFLEALVYTGQWVDA